LSVVAPVVIAALGGRHRSAPRRRRALSLDSVLRFAVQLVERRRSALDHGAGGNRVSGFEFRRGALPAKPGSILRRPEAHRKKIASDQHGGLFATVIGLLSWVSLAAHRPDRG
jgi:hypothetical protein